MQVLKSIYDVLIDRICVFVASMSLVFTLIAVIYDVISRTIGLPTLDSISTLVEYAMLVMTMAIAPYLVRTHGHVFVDSIVRLFSHDTQRVMSGISLVVCVAVCLIIAFYAGAMGFESSSRGELDIRSIIIPRWVLFALLSGGFILCAAEFVRILWHGAKLDDEASDVCGV